MLPGQLQILEGEEGVTEMEQVKLAPGAGQRAQARALGGGAAPALPRRARAAMRGRCLRRCIAHRLPDRDMHRV